VAQAGELVDRSFIGSLYVIFPEEIVKPIVTVYLAAMAAIWSLPAEEAR
jgi:hypothetical protein